MLVKLKSMAEDNRPATASGLAGAVTLLLLTLAEWVEGLADLPIPDPVQGAGLLVIVTAVGGALGKVAQRCTWPEGTHKAAVAYALQLDPEHWEEALKALGVTKEEALALIGVDPDEVP